MLRAAGRSALCGHVTKHPLLFSFHHFELQPCLKVMSTVVRFEKFVWWSNLGIYRFEVDCLHLNVFGWRRNDFCPWRIVLCWNCEELELRATWRSERGGKISRVTSEILETNYTLRGFWWVKWCFIELSHCQATQGLSCSVLLGWHPVVGVWLWLSSPQTKQERRKLLTKM